MYKILQHVSKSDIAQVVQFGIAPFKNIISTNRGDLSVLRYNQILDKAVERLRGVFAIFNILECQNRCKSCWN